MIEQETTPEQLGNEKTPTARITEAVRAGSVEQLAQTLIEVNRDMRLPELAHFQLGNGVSTLRRDLAEFFDRIQRTGYGSVVVHLGNGSSRLVLTESDDGSISIDLTKSSLGLRERWQQLHELAD